AAVLDKGLASLLEINPPLGRQFPPSVFGGVICLHRLRGQGDAIFGLYRLRDLRRAVKRGKPLNHKGFNLIGHICSISCHVQAAFKAQVPQMPLTSAPSINGLEFPASIIGWTPEASAPYRRTTPTNSSTSCPRIAKTGRPSRLKAGI